MNIVNYAQFLEPIQDNFTRIYSTMSGIIAIILILWTLNFIGGLIQRTYSIGKAFGSFYRYYMHNYLKGAVVRLKTVLKFSSS